MTRDHAADILFVLIGPELYRKLVLERGWTRAQWASFVDRSILYEIFDSRPTPR